MSYDSVVSVRDGNTMPSVKQPGAVQVYDPPGQTATVTTWQPIDGSYTKTTGSVTTENEFSWFYPRGDGNLENRPLDANAPGLILFRNEG